MKLLLVAGGLSLVVACSVLYNPNNLGDPPKPDAAIDAAIDAPPDAPPDAAVDAPPDMPTDAPPDAAEVAVMTLNPTMVNEGTGEGGSRPALVILTGMNFISPSFTLSQIDDNGVPRNAQIIGMMVSSDQTQCVLALEIPVLTAVGEGVTKTLTITAHVGDSEASKDLTIVGLEELTPSGNVDTGNLKDLYSRATFSAATHFFGTGPALVRVTSDITLSAAVDVDGVNQGAGAHGCAGAGSLPAASGGSAGSGGCGASGGGGGASGVAGAAGGGGGFATAGGPGGGTNAGGGGAVSGEPLLVHLTTGVGLAGNRGNGGGGGGAATLGAGGTGGGGAGVLELTADGTINVMGAGAARARGGAGGPGGGVGGGNGGGGSGGAIVIRSGGGIAATGEWLSAPGGPGAGSSNKGGDGGVGRVRLDTTTDVTGMVQTLTPTRGPAWSTAAPSIVAQSTFAIGLTGGAMQTYGIYLDGDPQPDATTDAAGAATVNLTLATTGFHSVCATVTTGLGLAVPESKRCISLVYLP